MSDRSLRAITHLLLLYTDNGHTDSYPSLSTSIFLLSWVPSTQSVGSQKVAAQLG